ncbi:MAG: hypothetical protein WAK82_01700 [Streptosporangiaceae bacterium]
MRIQGYLGIIGAGDMFCAVRPAPDPALVRTTGRKSDHRREDFPMPDWAEQVTAIATAVSAIGLLSAIGAVIYAGQQAREARIGRNAETAIEFFRRWSEGPLVEARRLVAQFETPEALREALTVFVAENSAEAYILYRELDYYEQLGALERYGGVDFDLIRTMLGHRLIDRWEMWQPSIDALGGTATYPMFAALVAKMRAAEQSVP